MIYHITFKVSWEQAQEDEFYRTQSLMDEGFIHCSKLEQLIDSAHKHYKGQFGLVVLEINEDKLEAELVYENDGGSGPEFPHIYGPLNIDAVEGVHMLKADNLGKFALPKKLQ